MVRAFPPALRYTGISFSYNIAYAVFGGITPPVVVWLAKYSGLGPAHYVAAAVAVGLIALLLAPRRDDGVPSSLNDVR
jgi:hypothetical protein